MLDATELIDPAGLIQPGHFPGDKTAEALQARVAKYLERAYAEVDGVISDPAEQDEAARQYAYWLAFSAVYTRMVTDPASVDLGDGGAHSYLATQMQAVAQLRDNARADFDSYFPDAAPPGVAFPDATAVPTRPIWSGPDSVLEE